MQLKQRDKNMNCTAPHESKLKAAILSAYTLHVRYSSSSYNAAADAAESYGHMPRGWLEVNGLMPSLGRMGVSRCIVIILLRHC